MSKTCGEQQRRRLAQNTTYGQDAARNDTIEAVRQHHSADYSPLSCAQTKRTFPIGLRNCLQTFLGVTHDSRQIHDCQRQWVIDNKEIYAPIVNQLYSEDRFNNMIKTQQVVLFTEKFANYRHFIEKYLPNPRYNLIGFSMEINDDWSLYCLNSALTSFAGYEWSEYPQLQYDERKLNVETRNINDWVQNNTKKKILMMHHPLPYLVEWADDELTKLLRTKFDLLLTGHTHRQNILCNQIKGETYVWCQAPQLYTDKTDKLGYCIIEIDNDYVERIIYREWFESRKCFKKGLDFTDGDDGIVEIDNNGPLIKDPIRLMFEERFRDTMAIYGDESLVWIDRYFSVNRFDRSFTFNQKNLYSEDDLIESKKSFKIVTPAQYGLTSFGWHFLLKLWKEKKIFGLFLDCRSIKINKLDRNIERQLSGIVFRNPKQPKLFRNNHL